MRQAWNNDHPHVSFALQSSSIITTANDNKKIQINHKTRLGLFEQVAENTKHTQFLLCFFCSYF